MKISSIDCLVAHTGYTGEDGVEIFVANSLAAKLWQFLLDHGSSFALKPCGLSSRDSLRLEAGMLLHGNDMNEDISPLQARLSFAVDLEKKSFIGQVALKKQKTQGLTTKLIGFRLIDRGLARQGFNIFNTDDECIGQVSSGTLAPGKDRAIGLGYVQNAYSKLGAEILIEVRNRKLKAKISIPRFI